jgi:hypothetical protein
MLRQAQHDKAQEALRLAGRPIIIEQYGCLKKFTTEQADAGSSPA